MTIIARNWSRLNYFILPTFKR